MRGERNGRPVRTAANRTATQAGLLGIVAALALALGGCGTGSLSGMSTNIFGSKKSEAMAASDASGVSIPDNSDVECPGVDVRTGAATLAIHGPAASGDPGVLDLRYQGTIIRTARECHVNAGVMTMKVGIEGRIITGPAGGPGKIDVPLRIAVVHEGPTPKTIMSKLAIVPVTIANAVDRVIFTHIESDISYPMPVQLADIDAYVVYVGFDPLAMDQKKKPARRKRR